jgi:tRNA (cmo5U34)-methyltransferase
MAEHNADTNAELWKDEERIKRWAAEAKAREGKRAEQTKLMAALLPFEDDDEFTVLDLGAGTGMAARAILDFYPRAKAVLADFSPAMMGEGAKALAPYDGRYRYVEFDMGGGEWPADIPVPIDSAVTSQCIHHLPDERKRSLFREIFERLKPGGWYVNFDPVKAAEPNVEHVWQRVNDRYDPQAAYKRTHRSPHEHAQNENHVRYMIDLDRQLGFFREAGFEAVDVYWKQLDYVIYGGRKPRS